MDRTGEEEMKERGTQKETQSQTKTEIEREKERSVKKKTKITPASKSFNKNQFETCEMVATIRISIN